jgi:hypothetical protein
MWGDWAEEGLLQAERAMLLLGMSPPQWMQNKDYYHTNVVKQVYISHQEYLPTHTSSLENDFLKWFVLPVAAVGTIWAIISLVRKTSSKQRQNEYTAIPGN